MTTVWVIPPLDVGEDLSVRVAMVVEADSVEELAFETGEKALGHSVVIAVPDRAHRGDDARLAAALGEGQVRASLSRRCWQPWSE